MHLTVTFSVSYSRRPSPTQPSFRVLTVVDTAGKPDVVKLFPTESSSCPSISQCYHILAMKISVAIRVEEHLKKVNLT